MSDKDEAIERLAAKLRALPVADHARVLHQLQIIADGPRQHGDYRHGDPVRIPTPAGELQGLVRHVTSEHVQVWIPGEHHNRETPKDAVRHGEPMRHIELTEGRVITDPWDAQQRLIDISAQLDGPLSSTSGGFDPDTAASDRASIRRILAPWAGVGQRDLMKALEPAITGAIAQRDTQRATRSQRVAFRAVTAARLAREESAAGPAPTGRFARPVTQPPGPDVPPQPRRTQ